MGQTTDHVEHVLGVLRGEAGGGFVKEVNVSNTDHIHASVETSALAAGEALGLGCRRQDGDGFR